MWKLILIMALFLQSLSFAYAQSEEDSINAGKRESEEQPLCQPLDNRSQLIEKGKKLYLQKNFDAALVCYERAYNMTASAKTLTNIATILMDLKREEDALAHCRSLKLREKNLPLDILMVIDTCINDAQREIKKREGCPSGQIRNSSGQCDCPLGFEKVANGSCRICSAGEELVEGHCQCKTGFSRKHSSDTCQVVPVYKKWWFWGIVGGAAGVATALGVGLGVGLSRPTAIPPGVTVIDPQFPQ